MSDDNRRAASRPTPRARTSGGATPGRAASARPSAARPVIARARVRLTERRRGGTAGGLDTPLESRRAVLPTPQVDAEVFGRGSERFARFMGTAQFILYMTLFVGVWLAWNTFTPPRLQFDPRSLNYTLLTLILSLQASYAAPLILLAQNRQADRDRVSFEQDRQRAERNLADTEYLAREVAALRIALRDVATRDFLRSELRDLLEELVDLERSEVVGSGKPAKAGKGSAKNAAKARRATPAKAKPGPDPVPAPGSSPGPGTPDSKPGPASSKPGPPSSKPGPGTPSGGGTEPEPRSPVS